MKKFTERYKSENKVSLEGLDKQIQEKLKNIDGQTINECCGCGCGCGCTDLKCCDTSSSCVPCCQDENCFSLTYYTESQIMKKLETDVTVQDLYNIRMQFNLGQAYRPLEVNQMIDGSPLFFSEKGFTNINQGGVMQANSLQDNKAVLNLIKSFSKKYGIGDTIVVNYITGETAVFGIKHTGTNGEEGSIKNSLLEIYNTLNSLQEMPEVSNASVCHVSIDACDDVYAFLIRISLDKLFIINSSK